MHFEYEITADEYVAAQSLYNKLISGRRRVQTAIAWVLAGVFLGVVAWNEQVLNWPTALLVLIGAWWIYAAIASLFPARYFRRIYRGTELAGKKFTADVNSDGFEVTSEMCSWRVRWSGVKIKGENEKVFMLCSSGTIFMFGKQYMNEERQQELRRLSGLEPAVKS